jgi:hypothetical protein
MTKVRIVREHIPQKCELKIQIIAEGKSDRRIIEFFIHALCQKFNCNIIAESKTQKKFRGKDSILENYSRLAKFLHKGFSEKADVIVICVDNDNNPCDAAGIGVNIKKQLQDHYLRFLKENKTNASYSSVSPVIIYSVPVETIDYWMKSIDEKSKDCSKIRNILRISRFDIKASTYGKENIFMGVFIDPDAIEAKINTLKEKPGGWEKLSCLPSYVDFKNQFSQINNWV